MAGMTHTVLNYMICAKKRYIKLMSFFSSDAFNPHKVTETIHPETALSES